MRRLALMLSLVFVSNGFAQSQELKLEDPPWITEIAPGRIVYTIAGMKDVSVTRDLVYQRANDRDFLMDVYRPKGARGLRPAVLLIHGGALPPNLKTTARKWGGYISFGELIAASGYVAVNFDTRFFSWARLQDPTADVSQAITYIRQHHEKLGIDRDRIILWAFSGGGLLIAQSLREPASFVRGIVAYYPVMNSAMLRERMGAEATEVYLETYSAVAALRGAKSVPPLLIARAGKDQAGTNEAIDLFVREALSKNVQIDVMNHPTGEHGFDVLNDDERSRAIIRSTLEFVRMNTE